MLLTMVPYLMGFSVEGEDWEFTGFVIGVEDGNSYIAKMLSGASGEWLFRSPYSAEEQRGVIAFLPYLLLGKLTAAPAQHEQLVVLFHTFRFISGILAILASYDFLEIFIKDKKIRFWALALVVLGGGMGWLLAITQHKNFLGSLPLDFISPESFGFLGLLGFPHLAASRALLLWGFTAYAKKNDGLKAGLLWLLMGFFQPMFILITWIIVSLHSSGIWLLERFGYDVGCAGEGNGGRKTVLAALQSILITSPLMGYMAISFFSDPYLKEWTKQNLLPSPHWLHYLLAYGFVLPFAIGGIYYLLKKSLRNGLLLAVWIAIFPLLISAPVSTQRRLAEGIWVVLVAGMMSFFDERKPFTFPVKVYTILQMPTTLILFAGAIARALTPGAPAFLPEAKVDAYLALGDLAPSNSLVLADFSTGNSLPAWDPVRVVIGHGPESTHLKYWQDLTSSALNGDEQANACSELFLKVGIDYFFWGPEERNRWGFDPDKVSCLFKLYNSGKYSIYQVQD